MLLSGILGDKRPLPLPIQRRFWAIDQSYELHRSEMPGVIPTGIAQTHKSLLRRPNNERHPQREITNSFIIQTQSSDKQDSQQALEFTGNTRGVLISRATVLEDLHVRNRK